jgi:hypothetical protein
MYVGTNKDMVCAREGADVCTSSYNIVDQTTLDTTCGACTIGVKVVVGGAFCVSSCAAYSTYCGAKTDGNCVTPYTQTSITDSTLSCLAACTFDAHNYIFNLVNSV